MSLEQLKVNQKEVTTPEMIEALEAQYEQEVAALQLDIETDLKEADKIKDEKTRSTALARHGLVFIELAEIKRNVMVSLN